jgi:hypothetical protein
MILEKQKLYENVNAFNHFNCPFNAKAGIVIEAR